MSETNAKTEIKTSSDGIDYPVLEIPEEGSASLTLDVIDYAKTAELEGVGGYPVHHLYVKCSEIDDKKLPLEANPREPSRTAQVKSMQETLDENPEDFIKKNNGIAMLCGGVEPKKGKESVKLTFNKNEGICNGGHTYFAIQTNDSLSERAAVHMEAMVLPPELKGDDRRKRITDISGARNNNNRLDNRSEADFLGYYDYFKEEIQEPRFISWHEGDSNAYKDSIDAVHYLRLMKSLDPFAYSHPISNEGATSHKSLATTRSRVHSDWMDQMRSAMNGENEQKPLYYLALHANDVLYLRDLVSHSLKHDSLSTGFRRTAFYQEYVNQGTRKLRFDDFDPKNGIDLKQTLEVLFLGLFRTNLFVMADKRDNVKYTGWFFEPRDLWDQRKVEVLDAMGNYFKEVDNDPKQFIRVSAPFEKDLFTLGLSQEPPSPDILYEIESQSRFVQTDEADEATHWLREEEETKELIDINSSEPSTGAPLYKPYTNGTPSME